MTVVKDRAVDNADQLNAPVHGGQAATNSLLASELVEFWDTEKGKFTNGRSATGLSSRVRGFKLQGFTDQEISDVLDNFRADTERLNEHWNNWVDDNNIS